MYNMWHRENMGVVLSKTTEQSKNFPSLTKSPRSSPYHTLTAAAYFFRNEQRPASR